MNLTASYDKRELENSLVRFASRFGETTTQAVYRWSVQTCREMAFHTQVWGRSKTQKRQADAISRDVWNVVYRVEKIPRGSRSDKYLRSPQDVRKWMDENIHKGKRTRWLPMEQRKAATIANIRKAVQMSIYRAGMAKGAWIGAGQAIAKGQRGPQQERIGQNFLRYAHKHAGMGRARRPMKGARPVATMINMAAHSGLSYVLSNGSEQQAVLRGLQNTIRYYKKAVRAMERRKR